MLIMKKNIKKIKAWSRMPTLRSNQYQMIMGDYLSKHLSQQWYSYKIIDIVAKPGEATLVVMGI